MSFTPNKHCSHCGSVFAPGDAWPKTCTVCCNITYNNPTPVVVLLQRVGDGILCVVRKIPPAVGKLALIGGFVDHQEDLCAAARRERKEETGIDVADDVIRIVEARTVPGNLMLVFCVSDLVLFETDVASFVPNAEVEKLVVVRERIDLAFPTHTEMLHRFLPGR